MRKRFLSDKMFPRVQRKILSQNPLKKKQVRPSFDHFSRTSPWQGPLGSFLVPAQNILVEAILANLELFAKQVKWSTIGSSNSVGIFSYDLASDACPHPATIPEVFSMSPRPFHRHIGWTIEVLLVYSMAPLRNLNIATSPS